MEQLSVALVLANLGMGLWSLPALGGTAYLTNGGSMESRERIKVGKYHVGLPSKTVILEASIILLYVENAKTALDVFEERLEALCLKQDQDAADNNELADIALARKLLDLAKQTYSKGIGLEPENERAGMALRLVCHADKWATTDQASEAKGFVKHNGRWPNEKSELLRLEVNQSQLGLERIRTARTASIPFRTTAPVAADFLGSAVPPCPSKHPPKRANTMTQQVHICSSGGHVNV